MISQLADFVSLLYPKTCYICQQSLTSKEEFLCLSCEISLPLSAMTTNKDQLLEKFSYEPKIKAAVSFLDYSKGGAVQKLIQGIKYQNKREMGIWLGKKFAMSIMEHEFQPDIIIPVPIHLKRQKSRGYNQSEVIAKGISELTNIPLETNSVERIIHTKSQTTKSKLGRWDTMKDIFNVRNSDAIKNKKIMLFDDVITTGATMGILCDEIVRHEPEMIIVASLAAGK